MTSMEALEMAMIFVTARKSFNETMQEETNRSEYQPLSEINRYDARSEECEDILYFIKDLVSKVDDGGEE